jgi:hypothetical protein
LKFWLNGFMTTQQVQPTLSDMAAAAKPDRNRAVDFYRAVAMMAVALGHWAAIVIGLDASGEVFGGNALEYNSDLSWMSWIFQVMPLFFVVGGFSSAMSLDSHNTNGGRAQDWVVARLRRMTAPAVVLAGTWLAIIAAGFAIGQGGLVAIGAVAAAIPLWFLSNYAIDTALAPYVLPAFRRSPKLVMAGGLGVYLALEALRFVEIGGPLGVITHLHHLNWVLGWLIFQVVGFAWRDGMLPTGPKLAAAAAVLWGAAIAGVTVGPYPMAMVHFDGIVNSPTYPPSLALMAFGAAYSATALLFAPHISRWLANSSRAWNAVVGANGIAMSVYLWHMTAAVGASALFYVLGWLPTADVGTMAWWLQKAPLMAASTVILIGIVAKVSSTERKALLAPRTPWNGSPMSMTLLAITLSGAIKAWAGGNIVAAIIGCLLVLALWFGEIKAK